MKDAGVEENLLLRSLHSLMPFPAQGGLGLASLGRSLAPSFRGEGISRLEGPLVTESSPSLLASLQQSGS